MELPPSIHVDRQLQCVDEDKLMDLLEIFLDFYLLIS